MPIVPKTDQPKAAARTRTPPAAKSETATPVADEQTDTTPIQPARRAPPPREIPEPSTDDLSWAASGDAAAAKAAEELAKQEERRLERRAEGYWPIRLWVPNRPGENQADIIILDAAPGPCYFEHMMRNPRNGFWENPEPCPKEFDSCVLCPPQGERDSVYTMLLTVLDMRGYRKGDGTYVPLVKNLWGVRLSDHPFIHDLYRQHGTLRGVHLLLTRSGDRGASYGDPEFVSVHDDKAIEDLIKRNGLWQPKVTRDGETIDDETHMQKPFVYGDFLKKPSGEKLRQKYGGAPSFGSASYTRGSGGGIQPRGGAGRGAGGGGRGGFGGGNLPAYDESREWGGGAYDPGQAQWEPGAANVDETLAVPDTPSEDSV